MERSGAAVCVGLLNACAIIAITKHKTKRPTSRKKRRTGTEKQRKQYEEDDCGAHFRIPRCFSILSRRALISLKWAFL
jgi:hypothetical protein